MEYTTTAADGNICYLDITSGIVKNYTMYFFMRPGTYNHTDHWQHNICMK